MSKYQTKNIDLGVLQGSILGPILFIINLNEKVSILDF